MRILRVAQKVYPEVKGGGAYHVHAMSRDQAEMGHDVTVLTVRQDESLPHVEERDGYTVVRYDPTVNLLGNDISPGLAQYLQAAEDFDVMHAHSHLYFSTNLAALKRQLGDIPLAITNHGLYSQNAPEWVFDLYLQTVGRWTFNQADVIFCYTDADRERVRELGINARVEVVSNGIDTKRFTPEGPESALINHDGSTVLFVGRLVEGKRPETAVDAVEQLPENIRLYICGEGPERAELENKASEQCVFLGNIPYEEMPAVYRAADLLVLPSRAEGTPRTVMEALSSGVPVVCSDLEHVRSAFGDSVIYSECEEIKNLADTIATTLAKDHTVSLSSHFRWQNTVEETTTILDEVTDRN